MEKIIKYLNFELNEQTENYEALIKLKLPEIAEVEKNNIAVLKNLLHTAINETKQEFVIQFLINKHKLSFDQILHWDQEQNSFNIITLNKDLATNKPIYIPILEPIKE